LILPLHVDVHAFTRGSDDDVRAGLLGYLQLVVGERLLLDGITLRQTEEGRKALSFPTRTDRRGQQHSLIRPTTNEARIAIERAVLERLAVLRGIDR
jgi:DNA-binding cell septation regulator SpoVG